VIDGTVFLLAPTAAGFGLVLRAMRRDRMAAQADHGVVRDAVESPRLQAAPAVEAQAAPVLSLVTTEAA
jgi:hypothetical protein